MENITGITNSVLGKDDFLKLLITELKYQDPIEPIKDKEFIAELAQFSSLEALTNMNENFEKLLNSQNISKYEYAVNLVNHRITGISEDNLKIDGIVSNVLLDGNEVYLIVNDKKINVDKIEKIY